MADGILVQGEGEATGKPDIARANLGVTVRAPTAGEATQQVNQRMNAVLAALKAAGLADNDLQTRSLSIHEERSEGEPVPPPRPSDGKAAPRPSVPVTHFVAQNMVEITVRDLDKLGTILNAATNAGVNQMYGIEFDIDDRTAVRESARELAMADARRQAEQLARLAQVELGAVTLVSTAASGMPRPFPMQMSARADFATAEMAVERGELTIREHVQVRFEIGD
jgi:hypothetical protein